MLAATDEPDGELCAGRTGRYCEHGQRTLTLQKKQKPEIAAAISGTVG
jgi:hypothetical protein